MARNVLGTQLETCCLDPVTGFYRNGKCDTGGADTGMHTICAVMTPEFLTFSSEAGNDLSTPRPELDFPGLQSGDRWCVCLYRWLEAEQAGCAPPILLEATHVSALEHVDMDLLLSYAHDAN